MVGNLADLTFDGQSAITQRGLKGSGGRRRSCSYVGNSRFVPEPPEGDPAEYEVYAGPKRDFLALAPWVVGDRPRDELREVAAELSPGSGAERENDYLETALIADLPFPVDPSRPSCNRGGVTVAGSCANLHAGSSLPERLLGTRRGDRLLGLAGADRLLGGEGDDCLRGGGGPDRIDCGPGDDSAMVDRADRVAGNCEHVRVARP